MILGDYLHSLVKKSGLNAEDEAIKGFLLNGELMKIEIPDDITKGIDSNLISLTDAKNNHPIIKPHYTELALKTVDKTIEKLLEEYGFDENDRADILSEGSTFKRVPLLARKLKELEGRKNVGSKEDKEAIKKQIDDLQAQLRAQKVKEEENKNDYENKLTNYKLNSERRNLYAKYKTTLDDLGPAVKNRTLDALLDEALSEGNAELKFGEGEKLTLLKKDGTNYYADNNQQMNAEQFLDSILAKNKVLVTTNTANKAANANGAFNNVAVDTSTNGRNPANGNGANGKVDYALKSAASNALADYNKAAAENAGNSINV